MKLLALLSTLAVVTLAQDISPLQGNYEFDDVRHCCGPEAGACAEFSVHLRVTIFGNQFFVESENATRPAECGGEVEIGGEMTGTFLEYDEVTGCMDLDVGFGTTIKQTMFVNDEGDLVVAFTNAQDTCPGKDAPATDCTCASGGEQNDYTKRQEIPRLNVDADALIGLWSGSVPQYCCEDANATECTAGGSRDVVASIIGNAGNVIGYSDLAATGGGGGCDSEPALLVTYMVRDYDAATGCTTLVMKVGDDTELHVARQTFTVAGNALIIAQMGDMSECPPPDAPESCECDGGRTTKVERLGFTRLSANTGALDGTWVGTVPEYCCADDVTTTCTVIDRDVTTTFVNGRGITFLGGYSGCGNTGDARHFPTYVIDYDSTRSCGRFVSVQNGVPYPIQQTASVEAGVLTIAQASDFNSCPALPYTPAECQCTTGRPSRNGAVLTLQLAVPPGTPTNVLLNLVIKNLAEAYVNANKEAVIELLRTDFATALDLPSDAMEFGDPTFEARRRLLASGDATFPITFSGGDEALKSAIEGALDSNTLLTSVNGLPQSARADPALPITADKEASTVSVVGAEEEESAAPAAAAVSVAALVAAAALAF